MSENLKKSCMTFSDFYSSNATAKRTYVPRRSYFHHYHLWHFAPLPNPSLLKPQILSYYLPTNCNLTHNCNWAKEEVESINVFTCWLPTEHISLKSFVCWRQSKCKILITNWINMFKCQIWTLNCIFQCQFCKSHKLKISNVRTTYIILSHLQMCFYRTHFHILMEHDKMWTNIKLQFMFHKQACKLGRCDSYLLIERAPTTVMIIMKIIHNDIERDLSHISSSSQSAFVTIGGRVGYR